MVGLGTPPYLKYQGDIETGLTGNSTQENQTVLFVDFLLLDLGRGCASVSPLNNHSYPNVRDRLGDTPLSASGLRAGSREMAGK